MHIESLKIFCDVVRHHSFSKGAEDNGITQSSASQTLHQLEERLGVRLIDRSHRPWTVTPEGRAFHDGCREIVERWLALESQVRGVRDDVQSIVRVASIYSVGLGPMQEDLRTYEERHPGAKVHIEYQHPDQVYESVLKEEADLGIVSFPQARRDLAVIPWRAEPMVLACPPGHRLAHSRRVAIGEIAGEAFVGFDRNLMIRREIDRYLRKHSVDVTVALEFDNIEAIKRAVEVASGVSILPRPTLEREVDTGTLCAVPFSTRGLVRPLGIIHRRGRRFSPNVRHFVDLLRHEREPAAEALAAT